MARAPCGLPSKSRYGGLPWRRTAAVRSRARCICVTIAPYGSWTSPITSALIVERSIGLIDARLDGGAIFWMEQRPQENRGVVVRAAADGARDLVAKPFSLRSRVHEYGGGAWLVAGGTLYFSNDQDRDQD